jgi:serine/threonine protein kinase
VSGSVGNFRLERELTRDATRTTFLATHRVMPRSAIIHMMAPDVDATAESYAAVQILREACLMAALQHAAVPAVYETGIHERRPWFAVEVVSGGSLAEMLAKNGTVERPQALLILRELAGVLHHAHVRGVVHCGLRPDHVVLSSRPHGVALCVTDWCTARAHDAAAIPYTPTLESWHFTAPEVAHAARATDRADTYSLGVIAHQLLAGKPFERGGTPTLDISLVPYELIELVAEMVSEDPNARPTCADVVRRATVLLETTSFVPSAMRIRRPRWTPDVLGDRLPANAPDAFKRENDDEIG